MEIDIKHVTRDSNKFRIEKHFGDLAPKIINFLSQISVTDADPEAKLRNLLQSDAATAARKDEIVSIMGFITVG
jgi:hypothetical protein